ncbi:MAG: histidinol-phosphate transaminase [Tannerellaceae bacterium]|jgi:histidinol-phosphate aminotransferase|nr:histidinol-phosphate transaminase [Tannerellaceae bacterium]
MSNTSDLQKLLRPNIRSLKPYSSARSEFHGEASVFLDANENPYEGPYNRYPDPMQRLLKDRLSSLKGVDGANIFVGNGSDEAIDIVIRAFCEPRADSLVTISPSYGMYEVAAAVNDVRCIKVPLDAGFRLNSRAVLEAAGREASAKLIYLCSPNNPTGNLLDRRGIAYLLERFRGIVVVDEAYIDFAPSSPSFAHELSEHPNLIVLQTLSKAWGAAGLRLGMAFAAEWIIDVMNNIKYPYNVSRPAQEEALAILGREQLMKDRLTSILGERSRLEEALGRLSFVERIYHSDANFLLVKVCDANRTYKHLVERKVIVRNRHTVALCEGCIRITVGTPRENDVLVEALKEMQP